MKLIRPFTLPLLAILSTLLILACTSCQTTPASSSVPGAGIVASTAPANTAIVPVLRDAKSEKRHAEFMEIIKQGNIDLVFLGDSITDFLRNPAPQGKAVWEREFAPRKAANLGISAERTQHVLWRIANGELDGITPKTLVLLIGTNNTGFEKEDPTKARNSAPEAIEGVKSVVSAIRKKLPSTNIILVSLFPREDGNSASKDSLQSQQVRDINTAIVKLADGKQIIWLDMYSKLINVDGSLRKELFMPDQLHPNEQGYELWAKELKTVL